MALLPMFLLSGLFELLAIRLVRSGISNRGTELWLGAFFALVGLSAPLRASAAMGIGIGIDPALANLSGQALTATGMICLNYFVWQVFREEGDWGRAAFFAVSGFVTLQMILFAALGGHKNQAHPINIAVVASMALSLGWAFGESLRYWRMLRKRIALGLGDEVIANRFGLWTLWTGALLSFPILNLSVRVLAFVSGSTSTGTAVSGDFAWAIDVVRALALVCAPTVAICTWLIFFPPVRYLKRIEARPSRAH